MGSFVRRARPARLASASCRLAVVLPAHNEAGSIARSIQSLQKAKAQAIFVVADNCSDATAEIARAAGATVLIREEPNNLGKGPALHFAFAQLLKEEFDAFLVVDADTTVEQNFLACCASEFQSGAHAIQCRYGAANPEASIRTRLLRVALLAFNVLRPRGRAGLGLSCGIYGNGFGLSREALIRVPYLASSVVEDLEYHLRLIRTGLYVRFVDATTVYGEMPVSGKGVRSQRERWEGGRIRLLLSQAPVLIRDLSRGNVRALEPLLDLLLMPLAFHVTLLCAGLLTPIPALRTVTLWGLIIAASHLAVAIATCGGSWKDVAALMAAPVYVGWKLLMLPRILLQSRAAARWIRTERAVERSGQ